jgi:putative thioredoxin
MNDQKRDVDGFGFTTQVLERSASTPVMVDFWAAWCGPCRVLTPLLTRLVGELAGSVVLAKVDVDREPALASRYGIRSLPTVKLFKAGSVVGEFVGALPEGEIRRFLEPHLGPAAPDPLALAETAAAAGDLTAAVNLLRAAHEENPEDYRLLGPLADFEVQAGELEAARRHLDLIPLAHLNERTELAQSRLRLHLEAGAASPPEAPGPAYARALQDYLAGEIEAAMDGLLGVVREHRQWRDGAARRALLDVFVVVGNGDERVKRCRSQLSAILMQ